MKAIIELELFAEDMRAMMKLYRDMTDDLIPGLGEEFIGRISPSSWVAEVTGFSIKYGYDRCFLKGKRDYSRANSVGSRGVFNEYLLESGRIYDIKSQVSWKNSYRYFCTVTEDGDIKTISASEVNKMLREREAQISG